MTARMERKQFFLEPRQITELTQVAEREARDVAEVVREYIDAGLERDREERAHRKAQRLAALRRLSEIRATTRRPAGDPLARVRAERMDQLDRLRKGET